MVRLECHDGHIRSCRVADIFALDLQVDKSVDFRSHGYGESETQRGGDDDGGLDLAVAGYCRHRGGAMQAHLPRHAHARLSLRHPADHRLL